MSKHRAQGTNRLPLVDAAQDAHSAAERFDTSDQARAGERTSKGRLPVQLTSFVGREREVAEVEGLLVDHRLLTLTGPGGSGKTRLALAVAFEVVGSFENGVWFVELAPLTDPNLVPQAVANAVGAREAPGRPLDETLFEHLRDKELLLILDNCEHLVEACAKLADALLRSCPRMRILATSRERLSVGGEGAWLVPSLDMPDLLGLGRGLSADELMEFSAVRLFVERAQDAVPAFGLTERNAPVVAKLCRRLDGIPLAIELAAARVRVLSVEQISSRLEDSFALLAGGSRMADPRQRTLRAAIDWSHELLSEGERVLFRRLSVFAGGFGLEAAEKVCGGEGIQEADVLELLSRLVEKSLVLVVERDGEARYRMLETVKRYGQERLEGGEEAERIRERHAGYCLALAEEAETELREQEAWLGRLEREHDNFRAALRWALDTEDAEEQATGRAQLGLRLAAALAQGRFWNAYGVGEGLRWLERGLAKTTASTSPVRAKAFRQAGYLAIWRGDYQRGGALLEEGMALYKELGDDPGVAISLFHLGQMAVHGRDRERTKALRVEAEALRKRLTDRQATGFLLVFLGMAAQDEENHDRAVALLEESLVLNRELGDMLGTAVCLTGLGVSALELGDSERAAVLYEEDLRLLRRLRDKTGTSYGLRGMAGVAALRGDASRAARLWGADEALRETIGLPLSRFDRAHPDYEGLLAAARSRFDDETSWEAARADGRTMSPDDAIEYALGTEEAVAPPPEDTTTSSLLSEREAEILKLVAEGLTNPQIAQRLYLSPRTIGQHLRSVYRKLGVPTRAAAAREAAERGLV
jgi:predicted ATPase/DNA-binding CsgD family transcriptional regulator